LYELNDWISEATYDHVFRMCPYPLMVQGRSTFDEAPSKYSLDSKLEQRLIP